jgi:hypothetical protein
MVEYSVISWALVVGLVLGLTVRIIPGPPVPGAHHPPMSVVELFFYAYQLHYDSYAYALSSPFP